MSSSRFQLIDAQQAKAIRSDYGSPVYIIDEAGVRDRYSDIQQCARRLYPDSNIAISYKTCGLPGLLGLLHKDGAWAEVVSGDEYSIARSLGVPHEKIIFNGPMKTDAELLDALDKGACVNIDHLDELVRIQRLTTSLDKSIKIGIRLNFSDIHKNSRFGFTVSNNPVNGIGEIINYLKGLPNIRLAGIHSHIGTNVLSLEHFNQFSRRLHDVADYLLETEGIKLEWINVGGGLAGITPGINADKSNHPAEIDAMDYCKAVIDPLLPYLDKTERNTFLFFEPGRTLFEPYGGILTSVVGRRPPDQAGISGLIVDIGTNGISLTNELDYPVHVFDSSGKQVMQYLFGPMCKERDIIHQPLPLPLLVNGDQLIIYGCGGYGMAQAMPFIHFRHGILLWRRTGNFEWLRLPETLEHINRLCRYPD